MPFKLKIMREHSMSLYLCTLKKVYSEIFFWGGRLFGSLGFYFPFAWKKGTHSCSENKQLPRSNAEREDEHTPGSKKGECQFQLWQPSDLGQPLAKCCPLRCLTRQSPRLLQGPTSSNTFYFQHPNGTAWCIKDLHLPWVK